ncbi:hypothetical protein F0L74_16630 [Chitinophaga agrisoli]|uniref:Uncharacterized protein n=1 Tax=Chitinophaga agrisoli TaxID=2607653 RepID=A0A5B2VSB0_9BACT|nr:hypothetical protein [Chitinophaga agrisoli]KAA2241520.1 hypothetical protein F0L74_16630 [Chitinophaga agrisoli]
MTLPVILSIWGAVLSTVLFGIKIFETYRDRNRLLISYYFGVTQHENQIIIANPSKTPAMIDYYELFWGRRRLWRTKVLKEIFSPDDCANITIPSYSKHVLTFSDEDYFNWDTPSIKNSKIYIRLYVVGGKGPKTILVYPQR